MANNAREFAIELDKEFAEKVEGKIDQVKKKIALQVLSGVTLKMPVDEGRARGNTNVSIGKADFDASNGDDMSGASTIARGQAVILGPQDTYDQIWIANGVPYINRLENGWSAQAPNGMFALTVAEINVQFSRVQ